MKRQTGPYLRPDHAHRAVGQYRPLWMASHHPSRAPARQTGRANLLRTEGIAPFVAVDNRHEDGVALGFNAKVQGRDYRNFYRHLCRISAQRGWYRHEDGAGQSLVAPDAELITRRCAPL